MTLHPSQGGLYPILDFAWLARHAPSWLQGDGPERLARKLGASSISLVQLRCKGSGLEQYHFMTRWVSALRSAAQRSSKNILARDLLGFHPLTNCPDMTETSHDCNKPCHTAVQCPFWTRFDMKDW
ncbi:MAG: hypothetical protein HQL62_00395 [Magnetococcales bacterium]|nr:hypothetical protein [Magnetococcales bacterium]